MFDHTVLTVSDMARSVAFFEAALKPFGVTSSVSYPGHAGHAALQGFGDDEERYLLLKKGKPHPTAVHLAFVAKSKKVVDAFYRPLLRREGETMGLRGRACIISPGTTRRMCWIRTATTWRHVYQKR